MELVREIDRLRKEKNAIIVAHNYQPPEIQDIADFCGDSLELARKAVEIDNPIIVFCGVYFMAETASILNPDKKVLLPDLNAGCPMVNFAPPEQIREWRAQFKNHAFIVYINSSAEAKAECDVCCTSSNAVRIVEQYPAEEFVFLPDQNLGAYVRSQVNKKVVLWNGHCIVHHQVESGTVLESKKKYPNAYVMAHPECRMEVLELADAVRSTGQMFREVEEHSEVKQFLVVTEWGMTYALKKRFPDREFLEPVKRMECRNMKKNTLEKVYNVLKDEGNCVKVEERTAEKARICIERMLSYK